MLRLGHIHASMAATLALRICANFFDIRYIKMRRGSLPNGEPRLFYSGGSHLWEKLSNMDLLKSAGLYAEDHATGKEGFNLAAVMLLGRDEVIRDVCPAY